MQFGSKPVDSVDGDRRRSLDTGAWISSSGAIPCSSLGPVVIPYITAETPEPETQNRGNLLDVLYSDESGRAYVLAGSVEGKLLVQPGCLSSCHVEAIVGLHTWLPYVYLIILRIQRCSLVSL